MCACTRARACVCVLNVNFVYAADLKYVGVVQSVCQLHVVSHTKTARAASMRRPESAVKAGVDLKIYVNK